MGARFITLGLQNGKWKLLAGNCLRKRHQYRQGFRIPGPGSPVRSGAATPPRARVLKMRGAFKIQGNPEESVCSERGPVQVVVKVWDFDTAGGRGKRFIARLFYLVSSKSGLCCKTLFRKTKQQQHHKIKTKQTKPKP